MRNNFLVELFKLYTPIKTYKRDRRGRFSKEDKRVTFYGDLRRQHGLS